MSTFQARVEDYIGTVSDTAMLTDHLTAGAKYIVDILPLEKLEKYTTEITDSGTGVSIAGYKPLGAHKSDQGARLVSSGLAARVVDTGSMYLATITSPVWYIRANTAYIKPGGGKVLGVAYPSIAYGDSAVSGTFAAEYEQGVVLYAALQGALSKFNDKITSINSTTFDAVSAVTPPNDASYTYSDATLGTYTATTIGSFGTAPTYTKPTISLSTALADLDLSSITIAAAPDALSLSAISIPSVPAEFALSTATGLALPSVPSAPNFSYTDAVLGTFDLSVIGTIPTAPTYTKPTTTASFTNATTYIGTDEDAAKATAELQKQATILDQYGKDLYNELNEFNGEMENQKLAVQKLFEQAKLDQEVLTAKGNRTTDLNIQNEIQAVSAQLQNYQLILGKYSQDLNRYQQMVNSDVVVYTTNLERYKDNLNATRLTIEKAVQEYQSNLARHQAQMSAAGLTVNRNVQQHTNNINRLQTLRSSELNQYQSDIQNELNEFNKEVVEYQASIQKAIEQARLDQERLIRNADKVTDLSVINKAKALEADIAEYQSNLALYSTKIQNYQINVNLSLQKYASIIQRYGLEMNSLAQLIAFLKQEFKDYVGRIV